jgi:hypothetical protein
LCRPIAWAIGACDRLLMWRAVELVGGRYLESRIRAMHK